MWKDSGQALDNLEADLDLLRRIALTLELMQRSPPEPIIVALGQFAGEFASSTERVLEVLERLADLALIEGPGLLHDAWLFRRLTPRGMVFTDEVRSEERWRSIKQAYGATPVRPSTSG